MIIIIIIIIINILNISITINIYYTGSVLPCQHTHAISSSQSFLMHSTCVAATMGYTGTTIKKETTIIHEGAGKRVKQVHLSPRPDLHVYGRPSQESFTSVNRNRNRNFSSIYFFTVTRELANLKLEYQVVLFTQI